MTRARVGPFEIVLSAQERVELEHRARRSTISGAQRIQANLFLMAPSAAGIGPRRALKTKALDGCGSC